MVGPRGGTRVTVSFAEFAQSFAEGSFTEVRLSYAEYLMLVREIPATVWKQLSHEYFSLHTPRRAIIYHKIQTQDDYYPLQLKEVREWPKEKAERAETFPPEVTAIVARQVRSITERRSSLSALERAGFLARSRSVQFKQLLKETMAFLRETLPQFPCHVSLSGGKDSTLCWYLAREAGFDVPAVHFDSGGEHPNTLDHLKYLSEFLSTTNLYIYYPRISYIEMLRAAYGGGQQVTSVELMQYIIDEPSARAMQELGVNAYIIGLRQDESVGRKFTGLVQGALYESKSSLMRIAPLLKWTWKDVWAATVLFDLPIHPAYEERSVGESLKNVRVGVLTDLAAEHTSAVLARFKDCNPAAYGALKHSAPEAPWPL